MNTETKNDMLRVDIENGKYTLVQDATGKQFALRYGKPWRDLVGDNLTLAMGYEIESLRAQSERLKSQLAKYREALEQTVGANPATGASLEASMIEAEPDINPQGHLCGICDWTDYHRHSRIRCKNCGVIGLAENMVGPVAWHECAEKMKGEG